MSINSALVSSCGITLEHLIDTSLNLVKLLYGIHQYAAIACKCDYLMATKFDNYLA